MLPTLASLAFISIHPVAHAPILHRVVTLGDSITQIGGSPKGYVTLLGKSLGENQPNDPVEVLNAGISGQKAPDMLARFDDDVVAKKPDLVTISVGVNDVWHDFRTPDFRTRVPEGNSGRGVPLPTYIQDVETMIDKAKAANIQVILISPTLVYEDLDSAENKRLGTYVRAEEALAKKKGVGFIDLNKLFRDTVSAYQKAAGKRELLLTVDGVHLNDAGNALVADAILKALGVPIPNNVAAK